MSEAIEKLNDELARTEKKIWEMIEKKKRVYSEIADLLEEKYGEELSTHEEVREAKFCRFDLHSHENPTSYGLSLIFVLKGTKPEHRLPEWKKKLRVLIDHYEGLIDSIEEKHNVLLHIDLTWEEPSGRRSSAND
ncbi:hypothetical protein AKJ37_00765 [candidate division MSBL1 archaeon SCGC-AAA259I09]|uniref:Uncharacterized protein n=1 Tax=candidate division MSBL1 archaeon SCGC-AAA259I09 TaxID=1698267 RepID=A0A133UVM3_9EURY|nr:hypothetical protein AKJ37_00765 [candidate division MSBL1 archaeon SCGC-AAA259I09]